MNKVLKYSIITFSSILLFFLFLTGSIFTLAYTSGIPLDYLNDQVNERFSKQMPGSDVSFNEAFLRYNKENGVYIEAKELEFFEPNSGNLLKADSIVLTHLLKPFYSIHYAGLIFVEELEVFDSKSKELFEAKNIESGFNCLYNPMKGVCVISFRTAKFNIPFYNNEISISSREEQNSAVLLFDGNVLNKNISFKGFDLDGNVTLDSKKSFSLSLNYWHEEKKLNVKRLVGDDIYISENGSIKINDESNELHLNLNINAETTVFNELPILVQNPSLNTLTEEFKGRQNIKIDGNFSFDDSFQNIKPLKDSKIELSGLHTHGKYDVGVEFHENKARFNVNKFIGNNYYLVEPGILEIYNDRDEFFLNLNFNTKSKALEEFIPFNPNAPIKKILDGFIGWQNFKINGFFKYNNSFEGIKFFEDSEINLSGVYDFRGIVPTDVIYDQFRDPTIYNINIIKDQDSNIIKINYFKNDYIQLNPGSKIIFSDNFHHAFITLITSFKKDLILDYVKGSLSQREANNNKLYDFLNRNLYPNQDMTVSFDLVPNSEDIIESIRNINVYSSGKFDSNYIFDDNKNPNYIIGIIDYELSIENLKSKDILVRGEVDLDNTEVFIRQINLKKKKSEKLSLNFSGNFKNLEESVFTINSVDSDYDVLGEVRISNTNHIFVNDFKINNNKNIDLAMSGDLSERVLNLDITGSLIDLSQNKVEINNKKKEYYLDIENYSIRTDNVIFKDNVKVDNFKASIVKEKSILSVHSSATFEDNKFSYSREKDNRIDTNIIISDDITHFVSDSHAAKKLLNDASIELTSIRNIENLQAEVNIKLDDFVLIDTPVSLKLLSLPSISGLVSIAEGEPGVRFGYGEIKYTETNDLYSNIEAFAVSDSLGLVMDGSIDRKKKIIDMKGEISPMHIVNAIIQKLPIIGSILVGNEGEGMFSIDFTLSGNQDDPDVDSVPLSIIKPRIVERAVELFETSN